MTKFMQRHVRRFINYWPPLFGAGIRITRWDADWRAVDVEMKLRWWNANFVGTHYGASLYSMTDPFYMVMLIENLGPEYVVWDKAASIRFRKPGRGRMRAEFRLAEADLDAIRRDLQTQEKVEPSFTVQVKDESGDLVTEVQKTIHIRKK